MYSCLPSLSACSELLSFAAAPDRGTWAQSCIAIPAYIFCVGFICFSFASEPCKTFCLRGPYLSGKFFFHQTLTKSSVFEEFVGTLWHSAQRLATLRSVYCKTTARPLGHHVLFCHFWVMLSFWPVYLAQKSCNLVISVLTCGAESGTHYDPGCCYLLSSGGYCSIGINSLAE